MKKSFFIAAVAALALASCSNDEVVQSAQTSPDNEISFRPLVNNVTRAAEITSASDFQTNGFWVTAKYTTGGAAYFTDQQFSWDNTNYSRPVGSKYYWPQEALDFFAFSPAATGQISAHSAYNSFTVTPDADAANQIDLVIANTNNKTKAGIYNTDKTYGVNGIPLNFRHAESRIIINLKNTSRDLDYLIDNSTFKVKMGYLQPTGTYVYTGSTNGTSGTLGDENNPNNTDTQNDFYLIPNDWTLATPASYSGLYTTPASVASFAKKASADASPATATTTNMILLPQELTQVTTYSAASKTSAYNGPYISVKLKIKQGDTYIIGKASGDNEWVEAIWPLTTVTWLPGHSYTYTLDLAGGGYYPTNQDDNADLDPILEGAEIFFIAPTVDAWDTGAAQDIDMLTP